MKLSSHLPFDHKKPFTHQLAICNYYCFHSDIAENIVTGTEKFEKLLVASRSITASTAQLVSASAVKARPGSDKLKYLKESSKAGKSINLMVRYSLKYVFFY